MNVNFKKLLPKIMQGTRWAELMESVQSVLETIRINKIDIIKNQYILEEMTVEYILKMAKELGYIISYLDGYTETEEYLKRQLLTLIPRITKKNLSIGYNEYIASIYNLTGIVYPMYYQYSLLWPYLSWYTSNEGDIDNFILDLPSPETLILDTITFPSLDSASSVNALTRHIVYNYSFNNVENSTEFISPNTSFALYSDVKQHKRKTEIIYFEPQINIDTSSGELTTETYNSWDSTYSSDVISKAYPYTQSGELYYDLSSGDTIRFGDSEWTEGEISSGSFSDVKDYKFHVDLSLESDLTSGELTSGELLLGCKIYSKTATEIDIKRWITQKNKTVVNFSELAILDVDSGCIYYASFPTVNFYNKMYTNVAVNINLV